MVSKVSLRSCAVWILVCFGAYRPLRAVTRARRPERCSVTESEPGHMARRSQWARRKAMEVFTQSERAGGPEYEDPG